MVTSTVAYNQFGGILLSLPIQPSASIGSFPTWPGSGVALTAGVAHLVGPSPFHGKWQITGLSWIAELSAAGTNVNIIASVYKNNASTAALRSLAAVGITTDNPGTNGGASTTILNSATGADTFEETDKIIPVMTVGSGDTCVLTGGMMYIYGKYL